MPFVLAQALSLSLIRIVVAQPNSELLSTLISLMLQLVQFLIISTYLIIAKNAAALVLVNLTQQQFECLLIMQMLYQWLRQEATLQVTRSMQMKSIGLLLCCSASLLHSLVILAIIQGSQKWLVFPVSLMLAQWHAISTACLLACIRRQCIVQYAIAENAGASVGLALTTGTLRLQASLARTLLSW